MAGLTDMEELLGRVTKPEINSYLREAFVCYGAGAYRACIVLTANALFEDLRQKTKAVASINADAKAISTEIEKLASEQKVFETTLVERLSAKGILSKTQGDRLKQITAHRNKAAHPSGVHASAEEARWVFFEAVDKYLSQPVLNANQMVDHIMVKLGDGNYFPVTSISNITDIAKEEVDHLHPLAFPYLIVKLVELVDSGDSTEQKNARFFLSGCAKLKNDDLCAAIGAHLVKPKASNKDFHSAIMSVVSADPALFTQADATTKLRLNTLFGDAVAEKAPRPNPTSLRHPVVLLGNLVAALKPTEVLPALEKFVDATIDVYYSNPGIVRAMKKPGEVRDKVLEKLLERAGCGDFDTANKFAKAAPDLDEALAQELDDKEALQVVIAIARAASYGAFSAKSVINNKFNSLPDIKAKALKYLTAKPKSSATLLKAAGLDEKATEFVESHLTEDDDDL